MVELASSAQYNPSAEATRHALGEIVVTLPLTLKKEGVVERHQIEGNDPSDRYFNRSMTVSRTASGYGAKVMYEALVVEGQSVSTIPGAVKSVVDKLRELGFRRMRTRANFKGRRYLAEKETWVNYPDSA
jgi:hypothetical protein